jgi:hypothetical protein
VHADKRQMLLKTAALQRFATIISFVSNSRDVPLLVSEARRSELSRHAWQRRIALLYSVKLPRLILQDHRLSHGLAACNGSMATTMLVNAMSRLNMRPCRALQASSRRFMAAFDALAAHAVQAAEHCAKNTLTTLHCVQNSRRSPACS